MKSEPTTPLFSAPGQAIDRDESEAIFIALPGKDSAPAELQSSPDEGTIESLLNELAALRASMVAAVESASPFLEKVHPHFRDSAQNLLHYLALRRRDLRPLQLRLAALGLSSLGRAESHALATVDAVLSVLHRLGGHPSHPTEGCGIDFATGQQLLNQHTEALLGPAPPYRGVRIMVTMPGEAANDYTLVHDLLKQGMDCMRINCAHDEPATWARIIEHLRRAEQNLARPCRVVMDLAGPKLRTGPMEPGPAVIRVKPRRDVFGRVTTPAKIWLTPDDTPRASPSPADGCLPVPGMWLSRLRVGSRVSLIDARGSRRFLVIVDVAAGGSWAELSKTAYFVPGTVLKCDRDSGRANERKAVLGSLPTSENAIAIKTGDPLVITRDLIPGRTATYDSEGQLLTPASIGCTIPKVFDDVRAGEAIWFDDGKIGGIVEKIESNRVLVRISRCRARGEKLRSNKGINLPESQLRLPALTAKDLADLPFVAEHADVVELSFANTALDVASLQEHLMALGSRQPSVVLKIETRRGFENLPKMLLAAMRSPCCGVMIARGDLAIESGFERLAEVQEEILWICEAAHVPVIWATQVLESMAKEGMPSRAEITDAAMGHRAECVMLNKGPHILNAVGALDNILRRMQSHQTKKLAMLRELHLAHGLQTDCNAV